SVLDLPRKLAEDIHWPQRPPLGPRSESSIPPFPWSHSTIDSFLQLCPAKWRPETTWAYRVYGSGQRMTVTSPLLPFISDRLTSTAGAYVDKLTLQNLLEHHSHLQPIAGDPVAPDLWGWISRMLAQGLSADPTPDTGDQYRNENYTLLRAVIENLS